VTINDLMEFDLFINLSDEQLESVLKFCHRQNYKRDNMIVIEEEAGTNLYLILEGKVKISRISDDGREVILSILTEGDFFGEMSVIDGSTRSANVTSNDTSELIVIKRDNFLNLLREIPQISINLLEELVARLRRSDQQIKALSLQDAVGKVASAILRLAENEGIIKNNEVTLNKVPSQQDLANMAGTSRETISRVLKSLAKDNYLQKDGNKIIISAYDRFKMDFS
jgi:CRP/FNR family cyclic AMP-dependent transcriptional regulator